jgi:hypothetical protein
VLDRAARHRVRQERKPPRAGPSKWQADYRRRQRDGAKLTEVPAVMIELLITARWLTPDEAHDKHAITQALAAFAKATLKNFR